MRLPDPALWQAFEDGHRFMTADGEIVTTTTLDAGALVLPTGQIVACDPILDPWVKPFSVTVPPDSYQVLLSLIQDDVALVMVLFGEGTPMRWKATTPKSFGVDSATGCLMDHKVSRLLHRKADADKYEKYAHRFQNALDEHDGLWGNFCVDSSSGANVVLYHTWGGDGAFPSFFGYNSDGELICLVIDMFLEQDHVVGSAP